MWEALSPTYFCFPALERTTERLQRPLAHGVLGVGPFPVPFLVEQRTWHYPFFLVIFWVHFVTERCLQSMAEKKPTVQIHPRRMPPALERPDKWPHSFPPTSPCTFSGLDLPPVPGTQQIPATPPQQVLGRAAAAPRPSALSPRESTPGRRSASPWCPIDLEGTK